MVGDVFRFHNQRSAIDKIDNSLGELAIIDALTGYGKTVFLKELKRIYSSPEWMWADISLESARAPIDVARLTVEAIDSKIQEFDISEIDETLSYTLPTRERLAIFFDDVQLVDSDTFSWIQREFTPLLKEILAEKSSDHFLLIFSGQNILANKFWGSHEHISLSPFDQKAIREYVDSTDNAKLRRVMRRFRDKKWLAEKIVSLSGGHPRASVRLIKALEQGGWKPTRRSTVEDDRKIFEQHIADELNQLISGLTENDRRLLEGLSIFGYANASTVKAIRKEFKIDDNQPPTYVIQRLRRQNLLIQKSDDLDPVVRNGLRLQMSLTNPSQYDHLNRVAQDNYETWISDFSNWISKFKSDDNKDELEEAQKCIRGSIYHCLCRTPDRSEVMQCLRRNISYFESLLIKRNDREVNRAIIEEDLSLESDKDIRAMFKSRNLSITDLLNEVFQNNEEGSENFSTSTPVLIDPTREVRENRRC